MTTSDLAPWLQACAAMIQGGAAVVIVRLTRRLTTATEEYVRLTRDVAEAARAQAEAARAQREADLAQRSADYAVSSRSSNGFTSKSLGSRLGALQPRASLRRTSGPIRTSTTSRISRRRNRIRSRPPRPSSICAGSVTAWGDRCKIIGSTGLGIDWGQIPWDEWARHLTSARTALDDLHKAVEASFATRASIGTFERMGGQVPPLTRRSG